MNQHNLESLLQCLKAMADENRLRMIGYIANQERNVSDLAELLSLTEPTVSHHVARLREAGLVNLRTDGNQRFYRLNPATLRHMSQRVADLEHVQMEVVEDDRDNSWIDALDLDEYDKGVLHDYIINRRLKHIPVKRKKLMAVLHWLVKYFQPGVMYTEAEVNAILMQHHEDFASLRRELIDFGFLRRERGGGKYWLAPEQETA